MNKTTSIFLLLLGMLLFLGSCAPFGYSFYHELLLDSSKSFPLSGVEMSYKASFKSDPDSLARFAVEADVSTDSVQEDRDDLSNDYIARFDFPIRYRINDANGNTLVDDNVNLAWKDSGSLTKRNEETTSTHGTLIASTNLDKFTVPADGTFTINIEVGSDTTYEAQASSITLHLYEGMIDNTWYIISGLIMLIIGFFIALIGFIVIVTDAAKTNSKLELANLNTENDAVSRNADVNQKAMFIHLSAFAGYIIPLGMIIVPLILWQIWKDNDSYIDRMGREAVNFQITMLLYYVLSVVLMFILIGFLLIFIVMIFHLIFIIVAAVQTSSGVEFRYPMIIRLIKS